jgi:hypothetical protein
VLPQDLTIHENNRLRSLNVGFHSQGPPIPDSMTTILLQISSPHICIITVYIPKECRRLIHGGGWDSLDEVISRPMFSGLTSVSFHLSSWEDESSWFKQKLPLCAARGILSVPRI